MESITSKIYLMRSVKVMLDTDLAELYGVETKVLKQAVRRNIDRFPEDFMFELTKEEFQNLRSHFGTSSWGGRRYLPMAFTILQPPPDHWTPDKIGRYREEAVEIYEALKEGSQYLSARLKEKINGYP